jgi:hypothetical protein
MVETSNAPFRILLSVGGEQQQERDQVLHHTWLGSECKCNMSECKCTRRVKFNSTSSLSAVGTDVVLC